MKLVSERSEQEVKAERAINEIDFPLRNLAANLMRIAAGAGDSGSVGRQIAKCMDAFESYREAAGTYPPAQVIAGIVRLSDGTHKDEMRPWVTEADLRRWENDGTFDRKRALFEIKRGALRAVASWLLGQDTQEKTGESLLMDGIGALERASEKLRRQWA